jgi:hypothetical protein
VPLKEWRTFAPEVRAVLCFGGVFEDGGEHLNHQELIPTNLAKADKLPTSKVWASSYGTGGEPARRIVGLREQNTLSGERRIGRLVLLLLYGRLIER